MDDLIKVSYEEEYPTISARDLHEALGIKTRFRAWFPRMIDYGFVEHSDYERVTQKWALSQF